MNTRRSFTGNTGSVEYMAGIKAFLIVLPTASGKSRIVEEDAKFTKRKAEIQRVDTGFKNYYSCRLEGANTGICTGTGRKIEIRTYGYMCADIIWNSQRTITIIS